MKKKHILHPAPRSKFLFVKCKQCDKESIVFSHTTTDINCKSCSSILAESSGSKARLFGNEFKPLD